MEYKGRRGDSWCGERDKKKAAHAAQRKVRRYSGRCLATTKGMMEDNTTKRSSKEEPRAREAVDWMGEDRVAPFPLLFSVWMRRSTRKFHLACHWRRHPVWSAGCTSTPSTWPSVGVPPGALRARFAFPFRSWIAPAPRLPRTPWGPVGPGRSCGSTGTGSS